MTRKWILDAQLFPYRSDEREIAFKRPGSHQAGVPDHRVYDRGYPAFWLLAAHPGFYQRDWCMRVKLTLIPNGLSVNSLCEHLEPNSKFMVNRVDSQRWLQDANGDKGTPVEVTDRAY